jgi:hypothetical protein
MKTNDLNILWDSLEGSKLSQSNLYKRYSSQIDANIFLGIDGETKYRWIGVQHDQFLTPIPQSYDISRTIEVSKLHDSTRKLIIVKLKNPALNERFNIFCQDIVFSIYDIKDQNIQINKLFEILNEWVLIFQLPYKTKLSLKKQIGLFGELTEFNTLLSQNSNHTILINSWVGPTNHHRDFDFSSYQLEIKSTTKKRPKTINIQSELQLRQTKGIPLFLIVYELEKTESGETINDLINTILVQIKNPIDRHNFRKKVSLLIDLRNDVPLVHFKINNRNVYHITDEFPNIKEGHIPLGIGNISFTLSLDSIEIYKINDYEES